MACGQKKQNTNEGGVHLTERTCSPYNPIIKLIVDDCLGLPIYPVTSIDAVIDEDGNTLRKLLDELLNKINEGGTDVLDLIQEILNTINNLGNTYVTNEYLGDKLDELDNLYADKDVVSNLQTLLWAISALSTTTADNEHNLYDSIHTTTPKIVLAVKDLLSAIGNGGDISGRLQALETLTRFLRDLLLAVANFDEGAHNEDGVLHYNNNEQLKIVKEILDIKANITSILEQLGSNDNVNPNENGTLVEKVAWLILLVNALLTDLSNLEGRVSTLEEQALTHAHLDSTVLAQMPYNSTDKEVYMTLAAGEYPPTSVYMLTYGVLNDSARPRGEHLEYLGFLGNEVPIDHNTVHYDVYPFGHTDLTTGNILYYFDDLINDYVSLKDENGNDLRAGNGYVGVRDIDVIAGISKNETPMYLVLPAKYKSVDQLYVNINGIHYHFGDINLDNDIANTGDINAVIDLYLGGYTSNSQILLPSQYSTDEASGYLTYYDKHNSLKAIYPCIEGKLYLDVYTDKIYRYTKNKMLLVSQDNFVGTGGVSVSRILDEEGYKDSVVIGTNIVGSNGIIVNKNGNEPLDISKVNTCFMSSSGATYVEGSYYIISDPIKVYAGVYSTSTTIPSKYLDTHTNDSSPLLDIGRIAEVINIINGRVVLANPNEGLTYGRNVINSLISYVTDFEEDPQYTQLKEDLLDALNDKLNDYEGYINDGISYEGLVEAELLPYHEWTTHAGQANPGILLGSNSTTSDEDTSYYIFERTNNNTIIPHKIRADKLNEILPNLIDYNKDGNGDINDITSLIDKVLGKESSVDGYTMLTLSESVYKYEDGALSLLENMTGHTLYCMNNDKLYYILNDAGEVSTIPEYRLVEESGAHVEQIHLFENNNIVGTIDLLSAMDRTTAKILESLSISTEVTTNSLSGKRLELSLKYNDTILSTTDVTDDVMAILNE